MTEPSSNETAEASTEPPRTEDNKGGLDAKALTELVVPNNWIVLVRIAGTIVFVLSAVAILLKSAFGGADVFALQQSINTMMKITALSIILLIITFTSRALSLFLSLVVVFSLLLPTSDVIRLVIVATRSDAEIDELYPRDSNVSVNSLYRSQEITSNIMAEVRKVSGDNVNINLETLNTIEREIQNKIIIHEVRRLAEHVIVRSLDGLLLHLHNQNQADDEVTGLGTWELHYADHFRFPSDIYSLKSQGLISMNYDDFDSIQLTSVGQRVAQALAEPDFFLGTRQSDQIIRDLFVDELCTNPGQADAVATRVGDELELNSNGSERWFSVSVTDGEHLFVAASDFSDPVVTLYDRNSLRMIGKNDDYQEAFFEVEETANEVARIAAGALGQALQNTDAALLANLEQGEYLFCVHDYWREPFGADVMVVQNQSVVTLGE